VWAEVGGGDGQHVGDPEDHLVGRWATRVQTGGVLVGIKISGTGGGSAASAW